MTPSFVWVSAPFAAPTTVPALCDRLMMSIHGSVTLAASACNSRGRRGSGRPALEQGQASLLAVLCSDACGLEQLIRTISERSGGAPVTGDKPALDIYLDRLNGPAGARTDGAAFTLDYGIDRN